MRPSVTCPRRWEFYIFVEVTVSNRYISVTTTSSVFVIVEIKQIINHLFNWQLQISSFAPISERCLLCTCQPLFDSTKFVWFVVAFSAVSPETSVCIARLLQTKLNEREFPWNPCLSWGFYRNPSAIVFPQFSHDRMLQPLSTYIRFHEIYQRGVLHSIKNLIPFQ